MSKKQFVVEMLAKMSPYWALAGELRNCVMEDLLNNNSVNAIIDLIRQMATYIKNKRIKENMLLAADELEHMKQLELEEKIQDQQDSEKLLLSL